MGGKRIISIKVQPCGPMRPGCDPGVVAVIVQGGGRNPGWKYLLTLIENEKGEWKKGQG